MRGSSSRSKDRTMTDSAGDEKTTQGRHFSSGVRHILAAGAVATALAAILGLGQALWPDPEKPAERLSATIDSLQVDPQVTLAEYLEDVPPSLRKPDRKASLPRAVFANASLAQSSPPAVGPAPQPQRPPQPTTTPPTQTQPPPATTPQPPPVVPPPPRWVRSSLGTRNRRPLRRRSPARCCRRWRRSRSRRSWSCPPPRSGCST